jgi:methyl-accepting chemotaxis protein
MRSKAFLSTRPLAFHLPGRLGNAGSTLLSFVARALAWPDQHLHWKIIIPYALLALILGCAATYLATGLVTGSLRERFDNQLIESARVSADSLARQERKHLETVRAITYSEGVPEAIASRDSARLGTLIEGTAANNEVQYLQVLDAAGRRLQAIYLADTQTVQYQDITDADTPATWTPVQEAIISARDGGGKATAIVETTSGPILYTAGAVESAGNVIGVVLTGTSLDTVVEQMKSEAIADVTVYGADRQPTATTFVQPAESASQDADLGAPENVSAAFQRSGVYREPKTVWGRDYHMLYAPLLVQGKEIGAYSVALPTDFILQAQSNTRWEMALLFGLGMAAILAVGFYVSRRITSRVHDLMRTAQQVSQGDFTARAGTQSRDEIGRLGAAVDHMTKTLQGQYLGTLRALASAVANKDPVTLGHSVRVGQLATMLGRHFELDERTLAQLEIGGYLHDVGKLGIRDSARLKLDALTPAQRTLLESHPHLDLLASGREQDQAPAGSLLESGRGPNSLSRSTPLNEETLIVHHIVEAADLYDAFRLGSPQLGGFTSEETLSFLRTQAGAIIPIGMLDALAAVIPDWERQRANDPKLQRLLVETALETT